MKLLKGKPVADEICNKIQEEIKELLKKNTIPTLGILRIGDNNSDIAYERNVEKKSETLGINVKKYVLSENSSEDDVVKILEEMNEDNEIHGILMFRPLPKHLNETKIINKINPKKDIDGISFDSVGGLFTGSKTGFPPCTAEAAIEILDHYGIKVSGKKVTVIGRSLVIGKPVAMMLLDKNATVTICHSRTDKEDLKKICKNSDIIISAVGKIGTIAEEYVNGNQVIVDVGINFDENGKMCGDVDFESVENKVTAITPVPGGVGGVTTVLLLKHVVEAAKESLSKLKNC